MSTLPSIYGKVTDGYLSVVVKDDSFKLSKFFHVSQLEQMQAHILELAATQDVYHSVNVLAQIPTSGRGTSKDFGAATHLFIDVDLKQEQSGVHAANDQLPPSLPNVRKILDEGAFPLPTRINNSGNGYHFFYDFGEPHHFPSDDQREAFAAIAKRFHNKFAKLFRTQGWKLDNVSDVARVTRLAGTFNHKTNPPKPVEEDSYEPSRTYSFEWLKSFTSQGFQSSNSVALADLPTKRHHATSEVVDSEKAHLGSVLAGCAWFRSTYENRANLPYNDWVAGAGILKHCSGGEDAFHEWSSEDPRYNRAEAEATFNGMSGPTTCRYLGDDLGAEACATCPAYANKHVGSPIAFGRHKNAHLAAALGSFSYVNEREMFVHHATGREYTNKNFNDHFARYFKSPAGTVLADRLLNQVRTTAYLPGIDELFVSEGAKGLLLNTWKPTQLVARQGEIGLVLEHLKYLIPDPVAHKHFLDVLAHAVQKPGIKIKHCILLIGRQGTGKSWLDKMLALLVGHQNVEVANNDTLASNFNARMADKQVLILEEVGQADRAEAYNRTKLFISEETVTVEEKHKPRYVAQSPRLMIGYSNMDLPIKIEADDRRFMFIEAPDTPRDDAYYKTLFEDGLGQAAAFLHFLQNRDISHFSPHARPPMTSMKAKVVEASRPAAEAEVANMIQNGEDPFDRELFRLVDLRRVLNDRLGYRCNTSSPELARVLRNHPVRATFTRP